MVRMRSWVQIPVVAPNDIYHTPSGVFYLLQQWALLGTAPVHSSRQLHYPSKKDRPVCPERSLVVSPQYLLL